MKSHVLTGLSFAAVLFVADAVAQTSPNRPLPAPQQPQMQRLPPVAPAPQPQSGLANRADPLIPVFILWEEGGMVTPSGAPAGNFGDMGDRSNPDRDRDGSRSQVAGGTDCDDSDPRRAPGIPEVVDPEGHDEDCDPSTIGRWDRDGDGFTSWSATQVIRNASGAPIAVLRGPDCDDDRRDVNPNASEVVGDRRDNNCDGWIDAFGDSPGHRDYCALAREVRASQAARTPCGEPRGDTTDFMRR
ncbi:MAG TPA: hypothetical protein DHW63_06485 [Hyphomonadaceae bacterium]|nr:hypothetical protein [Hyphomonadaceae bacterium]